MKEINSPKNARDASLPDNLIASLIERDDEFLMLMATSLPANKSKRIHSMFG